jgi:hypothetical protein
MPFEKFLKVSRSQNNGVFIFSHRIIKVAGPQTTE